MSKVLMYTTASCPYCIRAKHLLANRGVQNIEEIRVDQNAQAREHMMHITGRRTVPQIFIADKHIGGYDELAALDHQGELVKLLADL